jgi:translocation and assembly module TamA
VLPRLLLAALTIALAIAPPAATAQPARLSLPPDAPAEVATLLQRTLDTTLRLNQGTDAEDKERLRRRLRDNLQAALATEGYFTPVLTAAPADAGNGLTVAVQLGPRTAVQSVDLAFTGALAADAERMAALRAGWELPVGAPFRDAVWGTAKTALLRAVSARDFAAARIVASDAEIDPSSSQARLRVEIDSGPAFTFGALEIRGLERFQPQLIERFNPFRPGAPYDAVELLEFQRRLQDTPFFSSVRVEVDADPAAPREMPIRVEVTEAQTRRLNVGVGYSTNFGPQLELLYRQTLVFDRPYTLRAGAGIDRLRYGAFADLVLPPKPNGAVDSLGVLAERTDIENVETERAAVGAAREHSRRFDGGTIDTRLALGFQSELRWLADEPRESGERNNVVTTSYTWTRRTLDSLLDPRQGDALSLTGAVGVRTQSAPSAADNFFLYAYGRYLRYVPLSPRDQLLLRAEAGHVFADDTNLVPNEFLFRTGGSGSVRGYGYQSLGLPDGDAVLGSKSLLVGSVEYTRWFTAEWGGAAFFDTGNASDNLRESGLVRGYGLGVRWRTAVGPLALDAAWGEQARQWRYYFSVAITF